MSSLDPTFFGGYRLTARIATGGMAEVYVGRRVRAQSLGPMVAVKRLLPHLSRDRNMVQMFLNEARITAQIRHPNVVRIVDLGQANGEPFIAMELLDGHSLAELRQQAAETGQRVPLGIMLRILTDACRGLDAAHRAVDEQGRKLCIVHRDFTPDNIHVGVTGEVKVIDFGIAKSASWGSSTEPGTLKGKFFYMSPEMIAGREVDHRADLYAAGVMLYEQLCGRRPFTGNSTDEVMARIAEAKPRRPSEFDPSVPPELEVICLTALNKSPENRFQSLADFIDALASMGGAAQLAETAELGAYVSGLFPVESDPKRLALNRARAADHSSPGQPGPFTPAHGTPPATAPAPAPAPASRARAQPAPPRAPLSPRARRLLMVGVLASVLGGGALALLLSRPSLNPAQRLAAARGAADPAKKASLLLPLEAEPKASAEELAEAVILLLDARRGEEARQLSESYARRFPSDEEAALLESKANLLLRQGKRAEAALARARTLAPGDARPDFLLADLRELQGDLPGALSALRDGLKKKPDAKGALARQGYLLSQNGQLNEAEEALRAVLKRSFDPASAAELGFVLYRQGQVEEAAGLLRRALKEAPKLAKAHYYLGATLYRQGDVKGAERAYRQADALEPADPRALASLCELLARTEQKERAEETRKLLQQRFPEESRTLLANCAP